MKWKVAMPTAFSGWLNSIQQTSADAVLEALSAISKESNGPWELEMSEITIRKIPDESPALFRMAILVVQPNVGVLYGLVGNVIVPGAWGELPVLSLPATIKQAQELIGRFMRRNHG